MAGAKPLLRLPVGGLTHARKWLLPAALIAGLATSAPVLAQHRHYHGGPRVHFGVVIGAPIYPHWYYPPPRYYYPAPVVVQQAPPVYIEQEQQAQVAPPEAASSADAASYWYFCRESNTYYPYVKSCAGPWQRVVPQSPPG